MEPLEFEKVDCIICGSDDSEEVSAEGQFGLPTHVVICRSCGYSYLSPRWTKERYHQFYTKEYDRYYRPEVMGAGSSYDKYFTARIIVNRLKENNFFPAGPVNIIDIGSGMGDTLIYLKENVFPRSNYYAIEPSLHCIAHLESNGIKVISNDVDSAWDKGYEGTFDLVIMRHVLEHFLDPIGVLKKVSRILKGSGMAYIAVPNAMKPLPPLKSYYFRVVHVSYFSAHSLQNLFNLSCLDTLLLSEGDRHDATELYALCKPAPEQRKIRLLPGEFARQKKAYGRLKIVEPYYRLKAFAWKVLNKIRK